MEQMFLAANRGLLLEQVNLPEETVACGEAHPGALLFSRPIDRGDVTLEQRTSVRRQE